jgi:hypothetical protein
LAILRHDVDRKPANALKVARLEAESGLRATYYFRFKESVFKPDLIREIERMGHEIGYHYETLDKAKGDYEKAIGIFQDELAEFRKIVPLRTICMHGNPLTKWDNRDLWKRYDFREFGLVGEAYLSFDAAAVTYFSDTGRTWSERHKVKDRLPRARDDDTNGSERAQVASTEDVIELIMEQESDQLYLLSHPNRWSCHVPEWLVEYGLDTAANLTKMSLVPMLRRK